ncbi:DNA (cytosine-5-)-methyltransferase [Mycoplasma procyoni]|uniref:DNA (cytosine-5-)-methyltransferase n=1 Tax=Mycoplasma procyoni TaxID=568784 RepID=UPI00197C6B50|nr:DNA (cytosine-5-)-methyltransferase [Mycoplasma procyoni]MBN3534842.1 DNA (cytosine-5-)-methyltransferase [Mycoplasma procyoni]
MKFFDFCSGIGAGRLGLENAGFSCVGHSEINKDALQTYEVLFNDKNNFGDLTTLNTENLPEFDIMLAGFPCQTFSIAGKREGFEDQRGQIIFSLIKILKDKNIKYFILENVKGLLNHNKGQTLKTILNLLEEIGYSTYYKVLNSINFGVAQSRERIYIVGFKKEFYSGDFRFPEGNKNVVPLNNFFDSQNVEELKEDNLTFQKYLNNKYNQSKLTYSDLIKIEDTIIDWRQSDLRLYKGFFPTLRNGRQGLLYVKNGKLIKLNGYEAFKLQGFPEQKIKLLKSNSKLKKSKLLAQAGNAMTANVIEAIAKEMKKCFKN